MKTISKVLRNIFNVSNSTDKRHKIITILGIKIKVKRYIKRAIERYKHYKLMNDKSLYVGIPDNLTLQLCFNNDCNCRCKFCYAGIAKNKSEVRVMPENWLYGDFKELYPKTSHIVPTDAEITFKKEGYEYLKFIHENYPHINIFIESNGIAFDDKWAQLASENLMRVNFSVNAINEEYFKKTVWHKNGLFPTIQKNIEHYIEILKEKQLFAFKPLVSSVINSTNYETIEEFVTYWISKGLQQIVFFFDTNENEVYQLYKSKDKSLVNEVVIKLFELERIFKGKVNLGWQLFIPIDNVGYFRNLVYKKDIQEIKTKYPKLVKLIKDFDTLDELYVQRTRLRKERGKKEYTYYEDITNVTYHQKIKNGYSICSNPWHHLRLKPNGDFAQCSWVGYPENLNKYIENGHINWIKVFNCEYFRELRQNFICRDYSWKSMGGGHCMPNCPSSSYITSAEFMDLYTFKG